MDDPGGERSFSRRMREAGERARSLKRKTREEQIVLDLNLEYQSDIAASVINEVHQSNLEKIQFRNNVLAQVESHVEAINAAPIGDIFPYDEPFAQDLHLGDIEHGEAIGDPVPLPNPPHEESFEADLAELDEVGEDEQSCSDFVGNAMTIRDKAEVCSGCLEYAVQLNPKISQATVAALEAQNLILSAAIDSNDEEMMISQIEIAENLMNQIKDDP